MLNVKVADAGRGAGWLLEGFNYFKRSAGAWIGVTLLLIIISIVSAFIPLIGSLAYMLLTPVFIGGLILGCREQDQGGGLGVGHLLAGFSNNFGQLVLVGALYLAGLIGVMLLTGILGVLLVGSTEFMQQLAAGDVQSVTGQLRSIMLVVLILLALYVPLLMAVWFAPALVVLEDCGAVEAMTLSFKGCLKNIIPFLIYGLVGLVLTFLASIPLGLGWLILIPMIVASMYIACKEIFESGAVEAGP